MVDYPWTFFFKGVFPKRFQEEFRTPTSSMFYSKHESLHENVSMVEIFYCQCYLMILMSKPQWSHAYKCSELLAFGVGWYAWYDNVRTMVFVMLRLSTALNAILWCIDV